MPQSYFIWNNKDCRSMGIIMRGPAAIVRPEERVQHVEIPGRSGDLTELEGENIYNSYIQTVSFSVRGGFRVREVYKWLRGSGYVTFSGEPDRKQAARIIGAITLNRVSRNLDNWAGEVQFYCQPLKQKMQEEKQTVTAVNTAVINAGDVIARPLMKVTCNAASCTVTIGGKSITMTDLTGGTKFWLDCDAMIATNEAKTADWTARTVGDFPQLLPGSNAVGGSGWSSIEITKRERFL